MIEAKAVSLSRGGRQVLKDISATAAEGRTLGLVGPNGAGKSTLLSTMYRLLIPDEGEVHVDGAAVSAISRQQIAQHISVVAQHAEASLPLPVRDSVALGRLARKNIVKYGDADDKTLVDQAMTQVGLTQFADRLTNELSGGELQRVLIARAMVQQATHLLLDEPTNHLDIHHQYHILEMVRKLKTTTVLVLHDLNLASQFCDELVLMHNAEVVAHGTPDEVLTARRVSEVYRMNADVVTHNGRRHLVFSPKAA